jgi:Zn-dependent protease
MDPYTIGIWIVALLFALSFHEMAHAWAADRLGDPTARELGRLTINPIPHIDPVMTLLFPALLIAAGSPVVFGAAKPVPVDTRNLASPRRDHSLIAAAGPASNLLLAAGSIVLTRVLRGMSAGGTAVPVAIVDPVAQLLYASVLVNLTLAAFNLLPVHPLDGSKIVMLFLRGSAAAAYSALRPYGFLILIALMWTGILWEVVGPVVEIGRRLALG